VSYKVTEKSGVRVRAGFDMDSAPAGALKFGETIDVLETKVNAKGTTRLRFAKGWVSVTAGDGSVLLERAQIDGGGASANEAPPWKAAVPKRYKVVEAQGVVVRAGFDMKSKPHGQLSNGEEVKWSAWSRRSTARERLAFASRADWKVGSR
jgi:hypothetical protein